jgi:hypothetical protein
MRDADILSSEVVVEMGEMDEADCKAKEEEGSDDSRPWCRNYGGPHEPSGPPPRQQQQHVIGERKRPRTAEKTTCEEDIGGSASEVAIVKKTGGIFVSSTQMSIILDSISRSELAAKQAMLLSQSAAKAFGAECSNLASVKENLKELIFQAELETVSSAASSSRQ